GTHKYGRFDKTHARTTTTVFVADETDAADSVNKQQVLSDSNSTSSASASSSAGASHVYGLSLGVAALGAAAVLL
ncbi:hypothetical protein WICPIJ_002798, partial [Wickerhamomyces pijperi]